jgi:predicted kinase
MEAVTWHRGATFRARDSSKELYHITAPILYLLCGLPGSGKSTLGRKLAASGVIVLSLDEDVARFTGGEYDEAIGEAVAGVHRAVAARRLAEGRDVALDWGFDKRDERDELRALAHEAGAHACLIFFDASLDELRRRCRARTWPPTSDEDLTAWSATFERPGVDEMPVLYDGSLTTITNLLAGKGVS